MADATDDLQSWASREGLSDETVKVLRAQGYGSLEDLRQEGQEVIESFQKSQLLPIRQCLALKKAIEKLSSEDSAAAPFSTSGSSASPPTANPLPATAFQYGQGRGHPDTGSTTSRVGAVSLDKNKATDDLQSWASREGLSDETVKVLRAQGYGSLEDLRQEGQEVIESFQKSQLLPIRQCLALKKAIEKLSSEDSSAAPLSPSGSSASPPTANPLPATAFQYGRGRGYPDTGSTTSRVGAVSLDKNKDDLQTWASRERLSDETVKVLKAQGFASLEDLRQEGPEEVIELFQKSQLLPVKQLLSLKKAIEKLLSGTSTSSPTLNPSPASYPQYDQGMDNPDISSTTSRAGAVRPDENKEDPFMMNQPNTADEKLNQPSSPLSTPAEDRQPREGCWTKGEVHESKRGLFASAHKYLFGTKKEGRKEDFRFILFGKTGSGKSTTGNTIFGERLFKQEMSFDSVTAECELRSRIVDGRLIEIMDLPGLYDTAKTQEEVSVTVVKAVACAHPGPHAILYVIRLGRYTEEEFGVFKRLKALFDDNVVNYMIVLFTGGDILQREKKTLTDMLNRAPKQLVQVITECKTRVLIFNNEAKNTKDQVEKLFALVKEMTAENNGAPYICPKYSMIGDSLEKEVNKRLANMEKKDLKRQKYIEELEAKAHEAQTAIKELREELNRKEQERTRLIEEDRERSRQEAERLRKELEAKKHKLSAERQEQEQKALEERVSKRDQILINKFQEERQKEMEELRRREEAQAELQKQRRAEEERKLQAYQEEMNQLKIKISKNEEPGWMSRAVQGVASVVSAPFKRVRSFFGF